MRTWVRKHGPAAGLVLVCACLTAVAVGVLVWDSFRGYDISDEGFYLYAAEPANKANTANGVWGMYIGLLYRAVGYSIVWFRIAGLVLLVTRAVWFGSRACCLLESFTEQSIDRLARLGAIITGVAGALLYYGLVILTPSYNWLALLGILLALGGLFGVLAGRNAGAAGAGHVIAISAGCFLTFWGRTIAGAGLWVIAQVFIATVPLERRHKLRLLLIGVGTLVVLGVLHSLLLLSPAETISALTRAREFNFPGRFSTPFHSLLTDAIDETLYAPRRIASVGNAWPLLGCAPLLAWLVSPARRTRWAAMLSALAVAAAGIALVVSQEFNGGMRSYRTVSPAVLAVIVTAAIAWGSTACVRRASGGVQHSTARRSRNVTLSVALLLLVTAGMFAFTSNNAFLEQTSLAAVLGLFAAMFVAVVATRPAQMRAAVISVALVASSAAAASATSGTSAPHLDPPLARATTSVSVTARGASMLVTPHQAAYFRKLVGPARSAGFTPGMPLIDLTRFNPGAALALGAAAPNTLVFGYTAYTARWVLSRQDRSRWRNAWVLIRTTGLRRINPQEVLSVLGRRFPADYALVTTAVWPHGHQVHQLWRPRR